MIRVVPLASGSAGNCWLVQVGATALLVDVGLSAREIRRRLALVGLDPAGLSGLVVTHEHIDHVRGVGVLARQLGLAVYANAGTLAAAAARLGELPGVRPFETSRPFRVGELEIDPFPVCHDAAEPVGLVIRAGAFRIGLCQDLGLVTRLVRERLRGCQVLALEHNHDPEMLLSGPYPWATKQRIRSQHGHLSNQQAAQLLAEIAHDGLQALFLAHLSETNNHPELALLSAAEALRQVGLAPAICRVAWQNRPGDCFTGEEGACRGVTAPLPFG